MEVVRVGMGDHFLEEGRVPKGFGRLAVAVGLLEVCCTGVYYAIADYFDTGYSAIWGGCEVEFSVEFDGSVDLGDGF